MNNFWSQIPKKKKTIILIASIFVLVLFLVVYYAYQQGWLFSSADTFGYGYGYSNTVVKINLESRPKDQLSTETIFKIFNRNKEVIFNSENTYFTSNKNGYFSINLSGVGGESSYYYLFKPRYYLSQAEEVASISNIIEFDNPMKAGNLEDNDDVINSLDWSIMNQEWGKTKTEDYLKSDINQDGRINSIDWSLMNKNWGGQGDLINFSQ